MDTAQKRILLGSNGGLTGIYLAKQFRKMGGFRLYGTDSAELTTGRFFVDEQFNIPNASHPDFIDELVELLEDKHIDYYIPTHSKEMRRVSECADQLRSRSTARFLVSPIDTFHALESKEQSFYSLRDAGIPAPAIITAEPQSYPIIMKGKFGSGSSSVLKLGSAELYRAFKAAKDDVCFFECIEGKEYTTDCVFDTEGHLLAYNMRERVKTIGGAVVISQNSAEFDILPWLRMLESHWTFCGCVNFQFIVRDGVPYFIDINLRFPSGGLPLTVESGINVPEMIIRLMDGEKLAWGDYTADPSVKVMYRYYEEIFSHDTAGL